MVLPDGFPVRHATDQAGTRVSVRIADNLLNRIASFNALERDCERVSTALDIDCTKEIVPPGVVFVSENPSVTDTDLD